MGVLGKYVAYLAKLGVIYAAYKAYASFASNPIPVVGAISGGIAAAGILAAGFGAISGLQKVGDLDMSPNGGPIVYSPNVGGLFQGDKRDGVQLKPPGYSDNKEGVSNTTINNNSNRNSTTTTSVAIDYDKLANAIAMGAERGTAKAKLNVNLDGNAVSNTLQTPMAMGARRYSV